MDIAIKPARIGSIKPNAALPVALKKCASGVEEPKEDVPAAEPSSRKDRAIRIPPPTTNGSMWDTPFIRFL